LDFEGSNCRFLAEQVINLTIFRFLTILLYLRVLLKIKIIHFILTLMQNQHFGENH
jgi:hypothetical protein